jgi:hypothetical protein
VTTVSRVYDSLCVCIGNFLLGIWINFDWWKIVVILIFAPIPFKQYNANYKTCLANLKS